MPATVPASKRPHIQSLAKKAPPSGTVDAPGWCATRTRARQENAIRLIHRTGRSCPSSCADLARQDRTAQLVSDGTPFGTAGIIPASFASIVGGGRISGASAARAISSVLRERPLPYNHPPSTTKNCPDTIRACSDARNSAMSATSPGCTRPGRL